MMLPIQYASYRHKYKREIVVFSLIFGVRMIYALGLFFLFGDQVFAAYSDAESFITATKNFLEHGVMTVLTEPPYVADDLRTPGYTLFLAFFFLLKIPFFGIIIVQHILAGLASVMVYQIGKGVLNKPSVGIVATVLLAFEPTSLYWGNLLMADNLFVFLFVLTLFLFLKKRWHWSAFVLGLATIVRPIGLYVAPLLFLFLLVQDSQSAKERLSSKTFWKTTVIMCAILLATVSPLSIRNKIQSDTFELSSVGWLNLHLFTSSPFAREQGVAIPEIVMPADYPSGNRVIFTYDFVNVLFYKNFFFSLVKQYPLDYFRFHLKSSLQGATYTGYDYLLTYVVREKIPPIGEELGKRIVIVGNGVWALFLALLTLGFLKKDETYRIRLFFLALFVWNSLLLGGSGRSQGGRYNLPIEPFVLLLVGYGITVAVSFIHKKKTVEALTENGE